MLRKEFECAEHEDFGINGWKPAGAHDADPLGGMGTAHDVLEHFEDDIGRIADEFMALGAALWIRGDGGYWLNQYSFHSPGGNLVGDIPEIYRHYIYEHMPFGPPPKRVHSVRGYVEDWIEEAVEASTKEILNWDDQDPDDVNRFMRWMRDWLRIGYRRATRRFRHTDACTVAYLFREIEERADKLLGLSSWGDRLLVRVNLKRVQLVQCEHFYPEDDAW